MVVHLSFSATACSTTIVTWPTPASTYRLWRASTRWADTCPPSWLASALLCVTSASASLDYHHIRWKADTQESVQSHGRGRRRWCWEGHRCRSWTGDQRCSVRKEDVLWGVHRRLAVFWSLTLLLWNGTAAAWAVDWLECQMAIALCNVTDRRFNDSESEKLPSYGVTHLVLLSLNSVFVADLWSYDACLCDPNDEGSLFLLHLDAAEGISSLSIECETHDPVPRPIPGVVHSLFCCCS